jgi:selenocysteine lyase/cysteine desulfurase
MKDSRRNFLKHFATIAGSAAILPFSSKAEIIEKKLHRLKFPTNEDSDFWEWVKHSYTESANIINLNNGGVSPQPKVVQEAFESYNRLCNEAPSYYMWRILDKGREPLRKKLAALAGCSHEEIAINRNTTEALDTIIFGLNLSKGDEIVISNYDYPNMYNAWGQREKRDGIVLKRVKLSLPAENEDEIVKLFTDQFTKKTKIVHITHMINYNGQILPARKIADAAHSMGIEVVIDGAHSFAHLNYNIPDLGADYFGTSLHKWLCAPFGTGMIYVKKEKIATLWPTYSCENPLKDTINKFEHQGTRSFPAEQAIGHAIDFHNLVGSKRKHERLQHLKMYWLEEVLKINKVKTFTSLNPKFSCALATFTIEGKTNAEISRHIFKEYGIHTTSIKHEEIDGIRVTPHIYTTERDLDFLIKGIKELAS